MVARTAGRIRLTNLFIWLVVVIAAIGAATVLVLIGMGLFLSTLFALAVIVLMGLANYFLWGRTMEHDFSARHQPAEYNPITGRPVAPHEPLAPPPAGGDVTVASQESFPASDPPGWVGRNESQPGR